MECTTRGSGNGPLICWCFLTTVFRPDPSVASILQVLLRWRSRFARLPGSRGTVRQFSDGTMKGLRLPSDRGSAWFPSHCRSFPSLHGLRSPHACRGPARRLDVGEPVSSVVRCCVRKNHSDIPSSQRTLCVYALLSDPGRTSTPGSCGVSVLPPRI